MGKKYRRHWKKLGCNGEFCILSPAGEASKNLDTVKELYAFLIEHHYTRKEYWQHLAEALPEILPEYAAATYLRGIDFIQIPTTLLAQVDSSVGGKTGVDFAQYKNMVGAFHQPRLVYMNLNTAENSSGRSVCQWHGRSVEIRSDS